MIRRQTDLMRAETRLRDVTVAALTLHAELTAAGVSEEGIAVALRDKEAEQVSIRAEIDNYKRLRDAPVTTAWAPGTLPGLFVALRLRLGVSQKEFAALLGTHETNLSRDERAGYAGIGLDRVVALLDRLGLQASVVVSPTATSPVAAAFAAVPCIEGAAEGAGAAEDADAAEDEGAAEDEATA